FGMPTLLNSLMTKPVIPEQKIEKLKLDISDKKSSILSVVTGSLAGILVSIIPGITSSTGTILAMNAREGSGNEQTIVTLSSVNTASAFSVIVVLFVILRPRSGAALAVNELIAVEEWTSLMIPTDLIYLLMFLIFGGSLSYFLTLKIGKIFAKHFANVPYSLLVVLTVAMIAILVFIFTGIMGVLILIAATCIGFLPVFWGVRRSHCMGLLLIPIILHFL
ncbi:MAG: tripartite tricarboxylate transporter permease, partial [Thermoplasmatales archaeon]|nr:tripartite tricarboxylate transporter permease [Thermoplasmatales archaeon]